MSEDLGHFAQSVRPHGDTSILVLSCDDYADVWPVFFTLFFRYWPDCTLPIYLGANQLRHEDERVTAICVGEDRSWAQSTRLMLENLDTTYVLLFLEDYLLTAPVNSTLVEALMGEMSSTVASFIRFRPSPPPDRPVAGRPLLGELSPGAPYRVSLDIGLWRRETLISLLEDGETAWDMEIVGSRRSDTLPGFYCSTANVFSRTNGLERGKWKRYNLAMLERERVPLPPGHPVMSVWEAFEAWVGRCFCRVRGTRLVQVVVRPAWRALRRPRATGTRAPERASCGGGAVVQQLSVDCQDHQVTSADGPEAMLRVLSSKYGFHATGILHVGANAGQEADAYHRWGMKKVCWIEADPAVFSKLEANIAKYPEQRAIVACVAEEDGKRIRFSLASNDGGSSSALEPDSARCKDEWPGVEFTGCIDLRGIRLDTLVATGALNVEDCDLLCLDLQGSELAALRSLGSHLPTFRAISTEVNFQRMYHGAALLHEVDWYLGRHGFRRVRLMLGVAQGEAWYVRQEQSEIGKMGDFLVGLAVEAGSGVGLLRAVQSSPKVAGALKPLWRAVSRRTSA